MSLLSRWLSNARWTLATQQKEWLLAPVARSGLAFPCQLMVEASLFDIFQLMGGETEGAGGRLVAPLEVQDATSLVVADMIDHTADSIVGAHDVLTLLNV